MRRALSRGAIAGLAGGAVLAVVLLAAGEGPLQRAIDREPAAAGEELISRAGQRVGGVIAAVLVGIALGLMLAFVAEVLRRPAGPEDREGRGSGAMAGIEPWASSVRLAGLAFVVVNLVPMLKYPPNPPGVGDADTIGTRTGAFLALLAWSLVVAWAGWRAWGWLGRRRVPVPLAAPAVVAAGLVLVGLAYALLPPAASAGVVPAGDVWSFRVASLAGWAAYWAVAGTVLGWLRLPAGGLGRARLRGAHTPV